VNFNKWIRLSKPLVKDIQRWNWEIDEIFGDAEWEDIIRKHPECENMTIDELRQWSLRWKIE
jgi:hypothetical protein